LLDPQMRPVDGSAVWPAAAGLPAKQEIVGTPISVTRFSDVAEALAAPRADRARVIAVCNVHSVMSARRDPALAAALQEADVATPDGMPLVWGLRALGHEEAGRVYGEEIMRRVLADPVSPHAHFFFGATEEVLGKLEAAVRALNPTVRIAGRIAPPFRPLTEAEEAGVLDQIRRSGATVVWVGLGMPKQELWMRRVSDRLPGMTLIGVGAAFDFIAGTKKPAPAWMRERGLEWFYRFAQEPRRLWRRYLWNNPAYLVLLGRQLTRHAMLRMFNDMLRMFNDHE
jgi:N-acetylglucosaminyldiphosphoundecaprenol N-acetyl-beta-D-mannosaminyltransferase